MELGHWLIVVSRYTFEGSKRKERKGATGELFRRRDHTLQIGMNSEELRREKLAILPLFGQKMRW